MGAVPGTRVTATVSCPTGTTVLGGGGTATTTIGDFAAISQSYPSSASTWTVVAIPVTNLLVTNSVTATAFAICTL